MTILVTANKQEDVKKKAKSLQNISNNLSVEQIQKLEQMALSSKAREMLSTQWDFLKSFI